MTAAAIPPTAGYLDEGWRLTGWLTTTDHKRIAWLYLGTILCFFALGGSMAEWGNVSHVQNNSSIGYRCCWTSSRPGRAAARVQACAHSGRSPAPALTDHCIGNYTK